MNRTNRGQGSQRDAGEGRKTRSKHSHKSTLPSVFLAALQGNACIVELDNETVIRGQLESVDANLNMMMVDCVSKDLYGRVRESGSLHVRGGSVRYVHLAKGIDPAKAVRDHQKRLEIARREAYTRQQRMSKREKGAG